MREGTPKEKPMKIVLFSLNASRPHTNLAIRCLAKSLKQNGFDEVVLIERTEKDNRNDTLASLYRERADLYGFSTYIWNVDAHLTLAQNLKHLLPNSTILFGGPEVSYHDESFLDSHPYIDHLIRGEGEDAIVTLAHALKQNDKAPKIIDGGVYHGFLQAGVPYESREDTSGSILYYESSRGCPYSCAYCLSSLHTTPRVRAKSVEATLADLQAFEAFDHIRIIKFVDRTFNFDKKRAMAIWEALQSPRYTKNYHFEICASLLDQESLNLLSRFEKGKIQLEIGVQTTNPQVLAAINRRDDTQDVLKNLETLVSFGNMHIHADLIAGLPTEDYASIAQSFNDLYGKCDMLQLGFLKLLHGSPLMAQKDRYGYVYHAEAPYEVLANNTLSFEEISRLHHIEAVLERFSNSQRFSRAMIVLTKDRTPFGVFESLADYLPPPSTLSQREAYSLLLAFERNSGDADRYQKLKDALALDFLLNEQGHLPPSLDYYPLTLSREERQRFCDAHPEAFLPATECYDIPTRGRIFVDRKNKTQYECK
jgi:radical SAM superfamily enzyme YgiQ (UPF0313 family)